MINSLKGLWLTLVSTAKGLHQPVTRQYPATGNFWNRTEAPTPVQPRFMGFPALTWDGQVDEPYCTGCMVCIRYCPTLCMSATMKDNPLQKEGRSHRKKIVDSFEINLNRCILCGICVEVCNFDAIVMSHEHEMSTYQRNGDPGGPASLAGDRPKVPDRNGLDPTHRTELSRLTRPRCNLGLRLRPMCHRRLKSSRSPIYRPWAVQQRRGDSRIAPTAPRAAGCREGDKGAKVCPGEKMSGTVT